MKIRDKKFWCVQCQHETYTDAEVCNSCNAIGSINPIPKEIYKCYLNGSVYGSGSLEYMHELFKDYVITCKMYGKSECNFQIIKDD